MAHITVRNLNLTFTVRDKGLSLKDLFVRGFLRRRAKTTRQVHALRSVDLDIHEGERVGLIGDNGAGKSTLLKVLAGIYPPTSGSVKVDGQVSSLFDIKLGFEPDASGWENICFRGYLQGETPRTLQAKIKPAGEFSGLGDFLDMPVRCYSGGMAVRLAFSIATEVEPEILLIDEVLSVGDREFRRKAEERMREMMDRARLIVLVSHELSALEEYCDRIVWLEQGRVRDSGRPAEIIRAYARRGDAAKEPSAA